MTQEIVDFSFYLFIYCFSLKIYFSAEAIDFHWAHVGRKNKQVILFILYTILVLNFCLLFGNYVNIIFLIIYFLYMYAYSKSSFYGLCDIYITPLLLFFIFYQPNFFYFSNLDSMIFSGTYLPQVFLSVLGGLIFFSAGFEKGKSDIWKKNKAVLLFFLNPKFKKISIPLTEISKKILIFLNPVIVYSQLSLIFFLLFLPLKLSIIPIFVIFLFLITLSIFFHYSDLTLPSLILILVTFHSVMIIENTFLLGYIYESYGYMSLMEKVLLFSFSLLVIGSFIVTTTPDNLLKKNKFLIYIKRIVRFSTGLINVSVYNEDHLDKPVVQKFFIKDKNKKRELFQLYNNDGTPYLKNTFFLPSVYLCISFKILDILRQIDNKGKLDRDNYKLLQGIIFFMIKKYKLKKNAIIFFLSIYQFDAEDLFTNTKTKNKNFEDVLKISFKKDKELKIDKLYPKTLTYASKRSVDYKRYTFN